MVLKRSQGVVVPVSVVRLVASDARPPQVRGFVIASEVVLRVQQSSMYHIADPRMLKSR
jgi:hypothetical protein